MKNKVIAALADKTKSPEERYNNLLGLLSQKANFMQIRNFQLGYSATKLEKLEYEVKKQFEVSDLEIHEYKAEELLVSDETTNLTQEVLQNVNPANSTDGNNIQNEITTQKTDAGSADATEVSEHEKAVFVALEQNEAAKEGLKIRDQYPFLNDENCPDEFKILVADKISAWKKFAESQNALVDGVDANEAEDKLFELAKSAVDNFQLNDDIRKDLDFYKETGKVLGENPKLSNLKIKEEIYELSEAGLVEMKNKAQKNASKARKEIENQGPNEAREKRLADWTLREKLSNERLENEFKKQ